MPKALAELLYGMSSRNQLTRRGLASRWEPGCRGKPKVLITTAILLWGIIAPFCFRPCPSGLWSSRLYKRFTVSWTLYLLYSTVRWSTRHWKDRSMARPRHTPVVTRHAIPITHAYNTYSASGLSPGSVTVVLRTKEGGEIIGWHRPVTLLNTLEKFLKSTTVTRTQLHDWGAWPATDRGWKIRLTKSFGNGLQGNSFAFRDWLGLIKPK